MQARPQAVNGRRRHKQRGGGMGTAPSGSNTTAMGGPGGDMSGMQMPDEGQARFNGTPPDGGGQFDMSGGGGPGGGTPPA